MLFKVCMNQLTSLNSLNSFNLKDQLQTRYTERREKVIVSLMLYQKNPQSHKPVTGGAYATLEICDIQDECTNCGIPAPAHQAKSPSLPLPRIPL